MAAKTPAKPRKPEEVWYDVHKHPDGVPGGMGRSPEHHLRNRGWNGHEINEGSGKKTIQYRNHHFPDFVISYGGGTSQKPDHNFRVLYMGTNRNVPKVHHTYSIADAMNKVEELHQLQSGLVVQPLTGVTSAYSTKVPSISSQPSVSQQGTFAAPVQPKKRRDMNNDPNDHPIGPPETDFPTQPDRASDWPQKQKPQLKEIKDPPKPKAAPKYAAHGTLTGRNKHQRAGEAMCSLCRKASSIYGRDPGLYRELVKHSGGLVDDHLRVTSEFHDRVQVALAPRISGPARHPEGPANLGRAEYQRQRRVQQRQAGDAHVAQAAGSYGMSIEPWEVADYRGLREVVASLQVRETWEEA